MRYLVKAIFTVEVFLVSVFIAPAYCSPPTPTIIVVRNRDIFSEAVDRNNRVTERQLTKNANVSNLACNGRIIAAIDDHEHVVVFEPGWSHPRRLAGGQGFGVPTWLHDGKHLLCSRGRVTGADGDDGIWIVPVDGAKARELLPSEDCDFCRTQSFAISPNGQSAASADECRGLGLSVFSIRQKRYLHVPHLLALSAWSGYDWVDDLHLLVASTGDDGYDGPLPITRGLYLLDLSSGKTRLLPIGRKLQIRDIVSLPRQRLFAIEVGNDDTPNGLPRMYSRLYILNGKRRTFKRIQTPGTMAAIDFSPDGSKLLLTRDISQDARVADCYVYDIGSRTFTRIAKGVTEAHWLTPGESRGFDY